MEDFIYHNPVRVVFGQGAVKQAGAAAAVCGKQALLVSYSDTGALRPVVDAVHRSLAEAGVACTDYCGVTANPTLAQAETGAALCRESRADVVIGLGGGSVMDSAKIIAAAVRYPHALDRMIRFSHSHTTQYPPTEALPTVLIPTLPATGSEMNPTAVVTDEATKRKSYVSEPCLYARTAILDPELTVTLPPYQTACGAFDIIAHVLEAYLNGDPTVNLTLQDHMQEGVVRAVRESLARVWVAPRDVQARGVLMWAASIALNGWLTAGTFAFTPMHQMGHVISARYGATHGATLACMMPAWMRCFVRRPDNGKYVQAARRLFGCGLAEAADQLESEMARYGIETRLSAFGVREADLEGLTDTVVEVSFGPDGLLSGHPPMTREDIRALYALAL